MLGSLPMRPCRSRRATHFHPSVRRCLVIAAESLRARPKSLWRGVGGEYDLGDLYGVTQAGGQNGTNNNNGGSIFKFDTDGKLTTLYSFCLNPINGADCPDGYDPENGLELGSDGNFYSGMYNGGVTANGYQGAGYVFRMTPAGKMTTLYTFCTLVLCEDGAYPTGDVLQGNDGQFYGVVGSATAGGTGGIYQLALSPALAPPVKFTASPASINFGKGTQLTWSSSNAYSKTLQQCEAYYNGNAYEAVPPSGIYAFTPPIPGVYHLAIICGGQQGGFVTVTALNPTQTVLAVNPNPVGADSKATLKATVTQTDGSAIPTGAVQFKYGSYVVASGNLTNGVVSVTASDDGLPAGKYSIEAVYLGSGQDFGSSSKPVVVTVQ